jgi:SpoVK/Ycf46/Vps4 family AAA+-type ATPase
MPKPTNLQRTAKNQSLEVPIDKDSGLPLLHINKYDIPLDSIILNSCNTDIFQEILAENEKADILVAHKLRPKNKLLFFGPPGTGKTQTAKILSSALKIPLAYVNLPCVFSSYLGQTSANLQKIFDYIRCDNYLIFFDEFDAIASSRDLSADSSEVRRLVNSLLQLMDSVDSGIFIAATNNQKLLDDAVWRRFDEFLIFDLPDSENRFLLLNLYLQNFVHKLDLHDFVDSLAGSTGADIERICANAIKEALIRGDKLLDKFTLDKAIKRFKTQKFWKQQSTMTPKTS